MTVRKNDAKFLRTKKAHKLRAEVRDMHAKTKKAEAAGYDRQGECYACLFFETTHMDLGVCRRYAPRPDYTAAKALNGVPVWPRVKPTDWCGEWVRNFAVSLDGERA